MSAIGGAEVHVTGPGNRGVATNPAAAIHDGVAGRHVHGHRHRARLNATQTVSNVDITQDATTTKDFNLTPVPALEHNATTLTDQNGNGKVEPGETFQLDEQLKNTGHATATGVSATLSTTTPGIEITQATSTYPDIPEGGNGHELDALRRCRDGASSRAGR